MSVKPYFGDYTALGLHSKAIVSSEAARGLQVGQVVERQRLWRAVIFEGGAASVPSLFSADYHSSILPPFH